MSLKIEELKKKIIYRSSYRGNKEMDIILRSFIRIIEETQVNTYSKIGGTIPNSKDLDLT